MQADTHFVEYDTRGTSQTYSNFPNQNAHYPSQGQAYLHYTLPGAADSQLQSVSKTYDQNADQMAFGASSNIQSRAQHEATQSTYDELEPRGFPGVSSYAPQRGSQGCLVSIYLDSPNDLINPSPFVANMIFATRSAPAAIHRLETRDYDIYYKYVVIATAPAFAETASSVARIPLRLQLQQQSGLHARLLDVGPWLYDDSKRFELGSPLQESRKRKVGGLPDPSRSTKRVTPTDPQAAVSQGYASYNNGTSSLAYPGSLHSSMDFSAMQRKYTPYGRSHMQQSFQDSGIMMDAQTLNATSQSLMSPPTGQASWNSPLSSAYQSRKSPTPKPTFQISSTSSPNPACPQLVRTSTLQQQPNSVSTSAGSSSDGNFNHYALYPPNRAVLKIQGDVNLMQDNWTPEERSLKRRLVRFWREQSGSTINAYFNAVKPDERPQPLQQHERRISCIYWEERQEYYVTSVDTISLLESLVDQRFTVEEKNRIRRNLEGFKPETVSKTKPETESFFKLVMGFPNPKPRNIEKDVKAFPWPILAQALKKIISKYVSCPDRPNLLAGNIC